MADPLSQSIPALAPERLGVHAHVARALLVATFDVLAGQEYPPPSQGHVAVLDRPEDCCDAVVVVLRRLTAIAAGANIDSSCEPARWMGEWQVIVSRDCDATLGSFYNVLPDEAKEEAANALMFADLAALSSSLAPVVPQRVCRAVYPGLLGAKVDYVRGGFTPHRSGGCAGWTFDFRLSVPS